MEQVKLTIALVIAILLQWSLRNVAEPLTYIDFPLIVVVYAALQINSIRALLFGTFAGLAVDDGMDAAEGVEGEHGDHSTSFSRWEKVAGRSPVG